MKGTIVDMDKLDYIKAISEDILNRMDTLAERTAEKLSKYNPKTRVKHYREVRNSLIQDYLDGKAWIVMQSKADARTLGIKEQYGKFMKIGN